MYMYISVHALSICLYSQMYTCVYMDIYIYGNIQYTHVNMEKVLGQNSGTVWSKGIYLLSYLRAWACGVRAYLEAQGTSSYNPT